MYIETNKKLYKKGLCRCKYASLHGMYGKRKLNDWCTYWKRESIIGGLARLGIEDEEIRRANQ
jgi:hypothetical protein